MEEIKEERRQKKKQEKFSGIFIANAICLIIVAIAWMGSYNTTGKPLDKEKFELKTGVTFEVNRPGKIHELQLQIPYKSKLTKFERNIGVLIDLYGTDGKRLYSFYKNLWYYNEASDDYGKDDVMTAKIVLNEAGKYMVKAYVLDDELKQKSKLVQDHYEKGDMSFGILTVRSKSSGLLYYSFLMGFLTIALVAFLILHQQLGSVAKSWAEFKANPKVIFKPFPLMYMGMIAAFLILIIYWNYQGIGYAGYGDYLHSPNWFFPNQDVIYLG